MKTLANLRRWANPLQWSKYFNPQRHQPKQLRGPRWGHWHRPFKFFQRIGSYEFRIGSVTSGWLESKAILISKPPKPVTHITNLSLISLTSTICKLIERMVPHRIQWHLDTHVPLDPRQSGFPRYLPKEDSLLFVHNDVIANAIP